VPTMPRIARAVPKGAVSRPEPPGLPVFARIRWYDGRDTDVPAIATAWTRDAVEITWDAPGLGLRSNWIPAGDVSRHIPFPEDRRAQRPPDSRGQARMSGIGPAVRR
jgi:hypothetical protein